ncbi:MAG: S8 family serine peptidase, partial [Eubacteriales bacterium]|nr:S8 family serine peptidase [Eubacteriales bacterium]
DDPEPVDDPGEEEDLLVRIRFVSAQALTLKLTDAEGKEVLPEKEEPAAESAEEPAEESAEEPAEAKGFCPLKDVALEVTEGMEAADVTLTLEANPLPYGFVGMPEGYVLTDEDLEEKQAMADHDMVAELAELTPDEDYVDGEVYFLADDEAYAKLVAEAYNAELKSFEFGVAVLRLKDATVLEAVTAAADPDVPLPPVSPNYIDYVVPTDEELLLGKGGDSADAWSSLGRKSWEYWRDLLGSSFDPYLQDPNAGSEDGDPSGRHYQYVHEMINSFEAWGVTRGEGITVAVLDTGVANHEDLPSITRYVVDSSIDQGDNPGNPSDRDDGSNHGTHVAGIIGSRLGNGKGGAGVAPEVNLVSIQVLNSSGRGSRNTIIEGINKARSVGVNIVNMSLGGKFYDSSYEKAVRNLIKAGVTLVCTTGNDASNIMNYPGTFDVPGLICVGAVTRGGNRSGYSNFGSWQDIAAPGSDMWSTVAGNTYASWDGTSMAAPVVAGACALYMSYYGPTAPVEMEKVIKASVTNGVLDVSKFFEKDTAAPTIYVLGADGGTAPYNAEVQISQAPGDTVFYRVDGTAPSVKNGVPADGCIEYTGPFRLTTALGLTPGKALTIQALRVSGMGVVSKVAKVKVNLGYAAPTSVTVTPATLVPGKSVVLVGRVNPVASADQTLTWEIISQPNAPGASINAKTGELKAAATDSGTITVRAKSSSYNPSKSKTYKDYQVKLVQTVLTKKVQLSLSGEPCTKLTLGVGTAAESKTLSAAALDPQGAVLDAVKFSWASSNTKVAAVSTGGKVTAVGKGSATITCTAMDGSKVKATCSVTVQQRVTSLAITGPDAVAPGKVITLKAEVEPSTAANKKVDWSVDFTSALKGVTINNGKLSIPAGIRQNTAITVTATAADGSGITGTHRVTVWPAVAKLSLYLSDDPDFIGGGYTVNNDGTLKSITLFAVESDYWNGYPDHNDWKDAEAQIYPDFNGVNSGAGVIWTSSNPKVVTVEDGLIRGLSAGSATVTAKVADAGGKSTKFSVKVINPASSITVVSSAPTLNTDSKSFSGQPYDRWIGVGKTVNNKAVLGDAFGKPTITKVLWDYDVRVYYDGDEVGWVEDEICAKKLVKLSNSGAVTAAAGLKRYVEDDYDIFIDVIATTTDGTALDGKCTYYVQPLVTKLTYKWNGWSSDNGCFIATIYRDGGWFSIYNVTSSNPKAATAMMSEKYVLIYPSNEFVDSLKPGQSLNTTLKVTACDGSNKSVSIKIKFYNQNGELSYRVG